MTCWVIVWVLRVDGCAAAVGVRDVNRDNCAVDRLGGGEADHGALCGGWHVAAFECVPDIGDGIEEKGASGSKGGLGAGVVDLGDVPLVRGAAPARRHFCLDERPQVIQCAAGSA
jgi:hypothetical protein